jgi:hypothetical protein
MSNYDPKSQYPRYVNPMYQNTWYKTERHNAHREHAMFDHLAEESTNMFGYTIHYMPVSEYSLDSITQLWGEDINRKYLEKYTLKAMSDGENDAVTLNDIGLNRTMADRTFFISKKAFREITGKKEPLPDDYILWTQNNIVYQVGGIEDHDIMLGQEQFWRLSVFPRIIEGTIIGDESCGPQDRVIPQDPDECTVDEQNGMSKDWNQDGNIVENPDLRMELPKPRLNNDETVIDTEKDKVLIRTSWGNW